MRPDNRIRRLVTVGMATMLLIVALPAQSTFAKTAIEEVGVGI